MLEKRVDAAVQRAQRGAVEQEASVGSPADMSCGKEQGCRSSIDANPGTILPGTGREGAPRYTQILQPDHRQAWRKVRTTVDIERKMHVRRAPARAMELRGIQLGTEIGGVGRAGRGAQVQARRLPGGILLAMKLDRPPHRAAGHNNRRRRAACSATRGGHEALEDRPPGGEQVQQELLPDHPDDDFLLFK